MIPVKETWFVFRSDRVCPTSTPCCTVEEAIDAAVALARYDDAEYTVAEKVFVASSQDDSVVVIRSSDHQMMKRVVFEGADGTKFETS